MAKASKGTSDYKILSLRKLSAVSKIDYMKIYNTLSGVYTSDGLSVHEKTRLCNVAYEELKDFFDFMGFDIKLTRINKEKDAA